MRLIDADVLHHCDCKGNFSECDTCLDDDLCNLVNEAPTVNAIIVPNGATNGDMIKAMFPNVKTWEVTRDDVHCAYIDFKDICEIKSFPLSWWNSPYKKEVEE